MLKQLVLVALLCIGPTPPGAVSAQAAEHVVIILEDAFFPQKVNVKQGDIVRFVNESGYGSTIFDAQGRWVTPRIAPGEELLVEIRPGMTGAFLGMTARRIIGRLDDDEPDATDHVVR